MMSTGLKNDIYYTPNKYSLPDSSYKAYSTAVQKHQIGIREEHLYSPHQKTKEYSPQIEQIDHSNHKLRWFEEKTERLKIYLNQNQQIDKRAIKHIFEWINDGPSDCDPQRKILKQLSTKVKGLIKENNQLRQNNHYDQLSKLKNENIKLQGIINQFKRAETARQDILNEQNKYLRQYIDHRIQHKSQKDNPIKKPNQMIFSEQVENNSKIIVEKSNNKDSINNDINSLKRHFTNYVNTVVSENDDKLLSQKKYIETLEQRLNNLENVKSHLQHLKFEKSVKLQGSNRKSKNFIIDGPKIKGQVYESLIQSPKQGESQSKREVVRKLFSNKQYSVEERSQNEQMVALVLRSAKLQDQLSILRQKYEIQIEKHIRLESDKEQLQLIIQRLKAEKKDLQYSLNQKNQHNKLNQQRKKQKTYTNASRRYPRNDQLSYELQKIRQNLLSCGLNNFQSTEVEITKLLIERKHLKEQLGELKNKIVVDGSKYSAFHKELFLLREKNSQLIQNCQFYEKQLEEYEIKMRQISEQNEKSLAKSISKDIREMSPKDDDEFSGLSWSRKAHECITSSVSRLESLENQLKINNEIRTE